MEYKSIQERILEQLPATFEQLDLPYVQENALKYALNILLERGQIKLDKKMYKKN